MQQFYLNLGLGAVAAFVIATLIASVVARFRFPLPPNDRRFGSIDGLRGYLALSVLIHHFYIWVNSTRLGGQWSPPSIDLLNQLGTGSVGLFFMTTGLVFYPRILAGVKSNSWPTIFITRFFRITPLVIVATLLVTITVMARTGHVPDYHYFLSAARWITAWNEVPLLNYPDTGRVNAYVLWSLWYEWLFYLFVLPLSAAMMDIARARGLSTWNVPAILLVIGFTARQIAESLNLQISVIYYLPLFASGMLAHEIQAIERLRRALSKPLASVASVAALLTGMVWTSNPYAFSLPLFGFFFTCVACGKNYVGLLNTRGALVLGECSFGIYLLHGIVLSWLFSDLASVHEHLAITTTPILLPFVAIVVALLTPTTYLLVERPAMQRGKAIAKWWSNRRLKLTLREIEVAP